MEPDNPLRPLFRNVSAIKGIGPKTLPLIERVAGPYLRDVLFHQPLRFITRQVIDNRADLENDQNAILAVVPQNIQRGRSRSVIQCSSAVGPVELVYFNVPPQRINSWLPAGEERIVSGKVALIGQRVQITHPDKVVKPAAIDELSLFEAVYELTQGLTARTFRTAVVAGLGVAPTLPEWIDPHLLAAKAWPTFHDALPAIHGQGENGIRDDARLRAKERLSYDELFSHQLTLSLIREARSGGQGLRIKAPSDLQTQARVALPFELTPGQVETLKDVAQDLDSGTRMNRLLMGDVGSGKTVVAGLVAAQVLDAGYQVAVMGPTEILATQLFDEMRHLLAPLGITVDYLSGKLSAPARRQAMQGAIDGTTQVLCGTHALFQDSVSFEKLGLVIIDEQHRFGVEQRMRLAAKGRPGDAAPHMLLMSATPIPRTLVMAHYGDIAISALRDKPKGRKPINTVAIDMQNWGRVQDALGKAIADGQQAYWICPLVEESAVSDLAAAEDRYALLAQAFGAENVGLVHGRLSSEDKERAMQAFKDGHSKVLVATTVVEVGVNVPNASIIIIEQAERFGLAQLHQLRGRVGRGSIQSSCTLMYKSPLGETSKRRLQVMRETQDGFRIAEEDLNIRGSGDVIGTRQAGLPKFIFADAIRDAELLNTAASQTRYLREQDPTLTKTEAGKSARLLLRLFDRHHAVDLIGTG